jgi:hypothetical protein
MARGVLHTLTIACLHNMSIAYVRFGICPKAYSLTLEVCPDPAVTATASWKPGIRR